MAEPLVNGLDPRKKLYSALVGSSDKELAGQVKQFSYNKFNGLLDNNDFVRDLFMDISERGIVLDPKNPNASKDPVEFANAFIYREPVAKPQPKVQAAPAMQMAAPMEEEEAYTPPPQPLVGTPEYDAQLQAQYGGMSPTLGATFGGVPASFETKAQKKQEQISPVFKAQQLAFEDVPIAEEQRKAQRQFAKAEKQQQQAALRGGTGFEYQQEQKNKERGYGVAKAEDLLGSITSGGERIAKNVLSGIAWLNQASMAADPNMPLEYEQRQQQIKDASQRMYDASALSQNQFQEELAKRNIETSVLEAIDKGNYGRIPEATLYTIGDAAMQIIPSILTMGGSTYFQTLPEAYKNGVDAIAKEKGMSPEQVIASGDDALLTAQISSGIQSALERVGAGLISKSIASRGGYKAMRDWLLKQGVNRNLARGASLLGVSGGESLTEYGQEGTAQIGEIAAKSPTSRAFMDKLPKELFTPEATKRRAESLVGGLVGGFGLAGGGQAFQSAMDRTLFEAPKIGKASQRADMDIVQTDNKIQERNKIAQAMEEAVKGNPEAEGQIRAQYQKRVNEAAPTDEEVLNAYEGLAALPETEEKNTIRQNLEAYMAEKGLQPQPAGIEAGLGEGLRVTAPSEETMPPTPPIEPVAPEVTPTETAPLEEVPAEEAIQEYEDLASLGQAISGLEQAPVEEVAPEVSSTEEVVTIAPLNIEFAKNEGRNVNYQGIEGRIKIDSDGAPYIFTRDGDVVYIEGGLSGQTPQQLGVQPLADDVINEADVETVLEDETAPLDQNQLQYDFDNNTITLYGRPFTYEGVETNSKGQTTALRLRDANGKIKFVRNEDTILEFEIQKELYEKSRTNKQPTIESATAAAEQLQVVPITRVEQVSEPVQQEGSTSDTKGDKVAPAPKGKKKAAPVTPAPAAPKKEEAPKPEPKKEETPTETKPSSTTPQEGTTVEIAPQREGGSPRKMVFKDGGWKQNVGGDIVKVGPSVQQQAQEMFGGKAEAKPDEKEGGAKESLGKRLKGDALLNAEDTLAELSDNGATINPDGTVVVYHRTTKDKADAIVKNNEMFGIEDGVFFSTSEKGQAEGYGDVVVKMNVPIEQFQIDDTFGNEAHVRIPTKKANQKISISKFSPQVSSAETKAEKKYAKNKEEGGGLQVNETPNGVPYLSQSGGAEYEVPNGLQWEGNKLGGNFLDVIGVWNETNYINFNGGAYVKDASDVAEIMSLLENKSVEHSFAVHVDENEVPHIQFLNIGITSAAHFNAQAVLAGVKKFNSKKVYLVHNHPSGNLKLSEQDKKVTQNAQKLLEPLGVLVNHVVLNTYKKEYSVYENFDGMYLTTEGIPRKKDGGEEKLTTHIFNEQKVLSVPQKIVKSSQDAATFIQQIRLTALPKNAVLLLSQSNEIIGNYVFADNINYKELTDIISESGIVQGLIFYGNQNNIAEISEIKERLSNANIRVLDLLIVSSDSSSIVGYYESAADQGLLNDVQEKYGTNSVPSPIAEFTSKQESSASQEFDGMKKPSKIKTKSFDGKHGKGAFERMKNITDNFEDIMDGMSGKIKQDCL